MEYNIKNVMVISSQMIQEIQVVRSDSFNRQIIYFVWRLNRKCANVKRQ